MVLFQIPLMGYNAQGRIANSVVCPFYGLYKVKLLNVHFRSTEGVSRPIRIDSPQFYSNQASTTVISGAPSISSFGSPLFIPNYAFQCVYANNGDYEFLANMNGILSVDLVYANEPPNSPNVPLLFASGYLSFDFVKI